MFGCETGTDGVSVTCHVDWIRVSGSHPEKGKTGDSEEVESEVVSPRPVTRGESGKRKS